MDSEDSILKVSGGRDNEGKKKAKKKREKMISMDEFVAKHGDFAAKAPAPASSWAVMTENTEDEESNFKFDRSILPSAPKAAMETSVDLSQIPAKGPFSAYIGNLSYDASEEDLQRLFCKLEVDTVRIITDGGRPRGYAYVDFVTKEALVEALSYNEREWMNRNIRVDLATDKNMEGGGRPGMQGGGMRSNEPDRTEGDCWRRKDDTEAPSSNSDDRDSRGGRFGGDRDRDRGYGFGKDRDGDRRGGGSGSWGDRDRGSGGSSWGDRDRGSGGSSWGDRDRGSGGSSWGDRDRGSGGAWGDRDRGSSYGDRDRGGYGGGRDRGFGGDRDRGYGGDRDRRGYGGDFGDRDGGRRGGGYDDRYGRRDNGYDRGQRSRDGSRDGGFDRDSDRGGRFGGSREDRSYNRRDIKPRSRDGSLEHKSDGAKERPVLKLQPRTKPVENKENLPESTGGQKPKPSASSIFGAAKPVDTYAKEREIEEKLKKRVVDRDDPRRRDDDASRPRRSADEDGGGRRRKSSSGSGGSDWTRNVLPVQKPPPPHAGRRTSEDRVTSPTDAPKSPTSPKPADSQDKMVPAPPPTVNAWSKKAPAAEGRDTSNNAAGPRKEERQDDRKPPAGRGNRQGGDQHRDSKDRKPGGTRANGDGSGGDHQQLKKHQREKKLPKSIDEMPKFEEDRSRDFSTGNKYAFLMDEDNDVGGGGDDSNEDGGSGGKTEAPSS